MKIIYFAKGRRGLACLERIVAKGADISMIVMQPGEANGEEFAKIAKECGAKTFAPEDPNTEEALEILGTEEADVFVLAGYGLILKEPCISLPKLHCINLHGGRLPQYRGSSPLNWGQINDEQIVGISIIVVACGVDTGDVLAEVQMDLSPNTTIVDLHEWADQQFSEMLVTVLREMAEGTLRPHVQNDSEACYYPIRFPDDGMILWDQLRHKYINNLCH